MPVTEQDGARIDLVDRVPRHPHRLHDAGFVVLDNNVDVPDHFAQQLQAGGIAKIHDKTALVAMH